MSNQPLSPELRQLLLELHPPSCLYLADDGGPCDGTCPVADAIRRAHDLGVKAGLERAAQVAEDLSQCNECGWFDDTATAIRLYIANPAPDLSTCPKCGGPADNGHDREDPPNPYLCSKCEETDHAD